VKVLLFVGTTYIMVFLVFNGLRWVLTGYFVDIGGIVDHHSLFFSFHNVLWNHY
jgi:hypothetical protein